MKALIKISAILCIILTLSACKNEIKELTLSENEKSLIVGEDFRLEAILEASKDESEFAINWQSADNKVATVTEGLVKAIGVGKTTIIASAGDREAYCQITVIPEPYTQARLEFLNNPYATGISNSFILYMGTVSIDWDNAEGKNEVLMFEFNVDATIKDNIPTGVYNISDSTDPYAYTPYTITPGYLYGQYGREYGSWLCSTKNGYTEHTKIIRGKIRVENSGHDYSFEYEVEDENGKEITGTYTNNLSTTTIMMSR
ncbi:Ig-like domain-containing protein [Paludibacter sp. 221]|uniref:Ig-like domain-containing protein n=1 Tax=Paludibacter sp. 221 TaxID=2302939 RepID=UPI001941ECF4|nr:Ig-like domain-containing protein [Paludibacter sp. 221]